MLHLDEMRMKIQMVAREYPLKRVDLFGSFATGSQHENSDVDLLVEFQQNPVSLLTLCELQQRFEQALELKVDLVRAPLPSDSFLEIDGSVCLYEQY